jgi:hypothetical protein
MDLVDKFQELAHALTEAWAELSPVFAGAEVRFYALEH